MRREAAGEAMMLMRSKWLGVLGLVSGCSVADLPPLDARDGGDGDGGGDVPADVPDGGSPPPWSCEPAAPLALQWGTAKDEEASALLFAGERLWVGGYEEGGRQNDPLPHGDSRGFVMALGSVPAGEVGEVEVGASGGGAASAGPVEPFGAVGPLGPIGQASRFVLDLPGVSDAVEGFAERDGEVFVLGRTRGAFPGHANAGHYDGFLGRVDGLGLSEVVQFGDRAPQHPRQVVALGEDWLIGGFDDIDVDGNYVRKWTDPIRVVVSRGLDEAEFLPTTTVVDDMGGPVLAMPDGSGYFFGTFSDLPPVRGAFVTRYGRGGGPGGGDGGDGRNEVVWQRAISTMGFASVAALRWHDGVLVVAGTTYETLAEGAAGGQDAYVARLDPESGEVLSVVQLGSAGDDWVMDMVVDGDRVHVLGETTGSFEPGGVNRGEYDLFVVTVEAGVETRRWGKGTNGDERPMALAVDPCGRLFVAGHTTGGLAGGHRGGRDAFVLEVPSE